MGVLINLSGKTFGRLLVQSRAGHKGPHIAWRCLCQCGNASVVCGYSLRQKHTRSCGCLKIESCRTNSLTHGHTARSDKRQRFSPTYISWHGMMSRCTNPNSTGWKWYGSKGVRVCKRWYKFENFLADMGNRPKGTTIGRRGDIGNYTASNCLWQTWKQQRREHANRRAQTKQHSAG